MALSTPQTPAGWDPALGSGLAGWRGARPVTRQLLGGALEPQGGVVDASAVGPPLRTHSSQDSWAAGMRASLGALLGTRGGNKL